MWLINNTYLKFPNQTAYRLRLLRAGEGVDGDLKLKIQKLERKNELINFIMSTDVDQNCLLRLIFGEIKDYT